MVLVLSFIILGLGRGITILVVVKERPTGRLLLTPVKRWEMMASKYIVYTFVLALQVLSILMMAIFTGFYVGGNFVDLYIALFFVGFVGVSMSMLVSTISKTETDANQLILGLFVLIVLMSGLFIPIEGLPPYMQIIANILPLSHGTPLINSIVVKDFSVFVSPHLYWLIGLSIVLVALTFIAFSRKKYEA